MLLAVAGFASQAQVRITDSLLPQIAGDFHTTVGAAAMVVTSYAIAHGSIQLVIGPFGDRLGKYRAVAVMCAIGTVLVALCGVAATLPQLALTRLATGAAAGWIIPISMAYVGDVTPYAQRQPILGRYLTGQILGQLFGQAAGGVLGDLVGWRKVFFVLSGIFALATAGLVYELVTNPLTREPSHPLETTRGFVADYAAVLTTPFARIVILAAFIENALLWGAFAYIGAYLHAHFGISFTLIGLSVGCFGIGGLIYAALVKTFVYRLGQARLADHRRLCHRGGLYRAFDRTCLVVGAGRNHRDRPGLLHAAQHFADQRHADDAASARHRRGSVLLGHLCRPDRGSGHRRAGHRPARRGAALSRRCGGFAGAGDLVCGRTEKGPAGDFTRRLNRLHLDERHLRHRAAARRLVATGAAGARRLLPRRRAPLGLGAARLGQLLRPRLYRPVRIFEVEL